MPFEYNHRDGFTIQDGGLSAPVDTAGRLQQPALSSRSFFPLKAWKNQVTAKKSRSEEDVAAFRPGDGGGRRNRPSVVVTSPGYTIRRRGTRTGGQEPTARASLAADGDDRRYRNGLSTTAVSSRRRRTREFGRNPVATQMQTIAQTAANAMAVRLAARTSFVVVPVIMCENYTSTRWIKWCRRRIGVGASPCINIKQLKIIAVKAERKRERKKNPDIGVSFLPVRTTMDTPHGRSHSLDFTRRGHRNCLSVQRVESSLQETTTTDRRRYTRDVRLSQLLPSQNHVGGSETSRRADTLMLQLPHCRLHLLTSAATAST
jgi:hypothetical protein